MVTHTLPKYRRTNGCTPSPRVSLGQWLLNSSDRVILAVIRLRNAIADLQSELERAQHTLPLQNAAVRSRLAELPSWFADLGTELGIASLACRLRCDIAEPYRLFYRFPALACWLMDSDTDVFLDEYENTSLPPTVRWCGHDHLIVGHLTHSEMVIAVSTDGADPRVEWGYDGTDLPCIASRPLTFSEWLIGLTTRYVNPTNCE